MDFLIENGNYLFDPNGLMNIAVGEKEIRQRIMIQLCVRKGSFVHDENLGSNLHKLFRLKPGDIPHMAKAYVFEALRGICDVQDVQTQFKGDKIYITVFYKYKSNIQNVEVII